ncbi:GGDEF domain-containing protein [Wenzhouxiangella sp. XN201]|uniref:sensor domain-containing phosphodiesterase n=1 Tax=Wenzhouxiangella sp. XN201 TaxID=2710755 RepID=UPI0013CDBD02|nr:GGDEF domain-containing protein [Wenzhouxiangella sp. XN201]NEZ04943.1 GGDEF domain-containing protein [Wenzhouxiangella sp. XN201]
MASDQTASVPAPPIPEDEVERLEELRSLHILDTAAEERFDRYTQLVADVFDFPVVLVSLIDRDRQWIKSSCGLDLKQTERDVSFCAHAINESGIFIVPDAREDSRFADNRLVTGPPYIRFYAGCSVHGPNGYPLGTLCVIDREPRDFDQRRCDQLRQFAQLVEREICHRHEFDKLRESVEYKAFNDPLTRLPNKRTFIDRLDTLIAVREAEGGHLAVVLFNLGGLRYINQAFGVSTGDELLREVAGRLEGAAPADASPARLGGDEFVLVLPTVDGEAGAVDATLERIRAALSRPYHVGGREHFVNFQVGVSFYPEHGSRSAALLEKACAAIHTREAGVTATARHYSPAHALHVSQRLHMETRMRRGLEAGNFRFEYQPIVSLTDGKMGAVEALMRWDDDEVEDTSPSLFIPLAEQSGLILPLGEWALEEIIGQLSAWCRADESWLVPVTINVSAPQLQQPDFARSLLDRMNAMELEPSLVRIEVTEFSLVLDTDSVRENLLDLNDSGVESVIDDFGTGYCSMEYLRRMPISTLKIDRTFISGIPAERNDVAITRSILAMARSLELGTVAEGVERREQLELLSEEGCDAVQGFLLARPAPPEKIPGYAGKMLV